MVTFQPIDKILVTMPAPLVDEIVTKGGIKLYIDPTFSPEFNATVTGKVCGLPTNPKSQDKEIVSKLNLGDEVAFNYKVVINKKFTHDPEKFTQMIDTPNKRMFINGKKENIIINGLPYRGDTIWVGVYLSNRGERIDGIQGNESQIERWLSQFNLSKDTPFVYKNLIHYDNQDVWQTDYIHVYAKKTDKGIESLGDRIIMKEVKVDITERAKIAKGIDLPDNSVILEYTDRGEVVSGGEALGIKKGDVVFFDRGLVEKYRFWDEEYLLIKERRVHFIYPKENLIIT